jgi:signal transduction histidine kinase/ligand-binding sensor domain-containing protein
MPRFSCHSLRALLTPFVAVLTCAPLQAVSPHVTVDQLYSTEWTARDGAPTGIQAVMQSADGYLWVASTTGLFRFDGVQFEPAFPESGLLSDSIFSLWAPPEGGLWVGHTFGGATFIKDGHVTHYSEAEGLPRGSVIDFGRDASGTLWAATTRGLFYLHSQRWVAPDATWNAPKGVNWFLADQAGAIWAISGRAIFVLRPGTRRFEDSGTVLPDTARQLLRQSRDGVAWAVFQENDHTVSLRAPADGRTITVDLGAVGGEEILRQGAFDRQGYFWLITNKRVRRLDLSDRTRREVHGDEQPSEALAQAAAFTTEIFEDREGNVWLGSSAGLMMLREPAAVSLALPVGPAALASAGEGVWIGAARKLLFRSVGSRISPAEAPPETAPDREFSCFYTDPRGELWIGARDEIWHLQRGQWHSIERPLALRSAGAGAGAIQAMAMDKAGALWVSVVGGDVYRLEGAEWIARGGYDGLPKEPATVLTADEDGRLWFGYVHGRLARLENGEVTLFDAKNGMDPGTVLAITARGDRVWVGSERGLAWLDGAVFHRVAGAGNVRFSTVSGIAERAGGDVWLNTAQGAVHIEAAEIGKLRANPAHPVEHTMLNVLDGIPGGPTSVRPLPTIVVSNDGRVWLSTTHGAAWTDPERRPRNTVIPAVYVKAVQADGTTHDAFTLRGRLELPPRTRNVEISYTALSLTVPERVRFKYQLEGHDSVWQDVGTRRQAFYTDLEPGQYRFRVIASNNDGLWNETGAAIDLIMPPIFVQTRWFTALWFSIVLGLLLLVFSWWLRQAKAQLRWRLEERMLERERIARDLHDTFLQGVQGLMLRFQLAMDRIPPHEPARALMEDALESADRVLLDGRRKVTNLRASTLEDSDLPEALSLFGSEMMRDYGVSFALSVEGGVRPLQPVAREEAFRIAAEAIANAFRHAQAKRIDVRIAYGRSSISLEVKDDGQGFEPGKPAPAGHWGLKGMQERAARVRGRLVVLSKPGEGTTIELQVPARVAFKRNSRAGLVSPDRA